jgi:beta-lactamase class A
MTAGLGQIAASFRGNEETFTVGQLLAAAVSHSDNTAADVLLELVGGPAVVTAFLRAHGIQGMRIDRGEDEIAREFQVSTEQRIEESKQTPEARHARLRRGYEAFAHRGRAFDGVARL